jgi:hypothetical protein
VALGRTLDPDRDERAGAQAARVILWVERTLEIAHERLSKTCWCYRPQRCDRETRTHARHDTVSLAAMAGDPG